MPTIPKVSLPISPVNQSAVIPTNTIRQARDVKHLDEQKRAAWMFIKTFASVGIISLLYGTSLHFEWHETWWRDCEGCNAKSFMRTFSIINGTASMSFAWLVLWGHRELLFSKKGEKANG